MNYTITVETTCTSFSSLFSSLLFCATWRFSSSFSLSIRSSATFMAAWKVWLFHTNYITSSIAKWFWGGCLKVISIAPASLLSSSSSVLQFPSSARPAASLGPPWLHRERERECVCVWTLWYKQTCNRVSYSYSTRADVVNVRVQK